MDGLIIIPLFLAAAVVAWLIPTIGKAIYSAVTGGREMPSPFPVSMLMLVSLGLVAAAVYMLLSADVINTPLVTGALMFVAIAAVLFTLAVLTLKGKITMKYGYKMGSYSHKIRAGGKPADEKLVLRLMGIGFAVFIVIFIVGIMF